MSNRTLARLPTNIKDLFQVYTHVSNKLASLHSTANGHFFLKTTPQYQALNKQMLVRRKSAPHQVIFNHLDFPRVELELFAKIFDSPLNYELEAERSLRAYIKKQYGPMRLHVDDETTLISDRENISKRFSRYQARILSNFASCYGPLATPQVYLKSLIWYRRLLARTPVIFFLKQKQRLFSEPSLNQINLAYNSFKDSIRKLCKDFYADESLSRRARNYYCTDLTTTDLLSLAVKCEHLRSVSEQDLQSSKFWSSFKEKDKLVEYLREVQRPKVVLNREEIFDTQEIDLDSLAFGSSQELIKSYDKSPQKMAYDILYNDLYILAIEEDVLGDDHTKLLNVIEQASDIEIAAVRLDRNKVSAVEIAKKASVTKRGSMKTYNELLRMVAANSTESTSSMELMLQRLGEWGMLNVHENKSKSAFYLFK